MHSASAVVILARKLQQGWGLKPQLWQRSYCQLRASEVESHSPLGMWLLVGFPCPSMGLTPIGVWATPAELRNLKKLIMCIMFGEAVCTCVCSTCRSQRRVSNSLELELQAVVDYPVWVLGTQPSFGRAINTLNC